MMFSEKNVCSYRDFRVNTAEVGGGVRFTGGVRLLFCTIDCGSHRGLLNTGVKNVEGCFDNRILKMTTAPGSYRTLCRR